MNVPGPNKRILIVDDNPAIHADMRKILCPDLCESRAGLDEMEAAIFEDAPTKTRSGVAVCFEVDHATQGQEGLALLVKSIEEERPYAMAFVDMRMPPGWDGLETTLALWKASPHLQIVICSAYSDYSWEDLIDRIGSTDRLVILKKPFESVEVLQLANALTTKWTFELQARNQAAELEQRVRIRTAELETSNTALKSEITRRERVEENLVSARDAAEAADRAKSTFLANMSHEVRTPMNGVIGMANLLLNTRLDEEQRELVHTITQSGESLLAIINEILDFSKVEAGKVTLENIPFHLADELSLAIDLNSDQAARKSVELILDMEPGAPGALVGDPVRIRQVLINLVSNAIKFTEHGEVVVRVRSAGLDNGRCRLHVEVADTGIGIGPDALATLFQPFIQADASMTRRFGGTGLGLAICRRLVELMGGEIGAKSDPGRGSTFWFDVMLDMPEQDGTAVHALNGSSGFAGRRVLVAEDNVTCRSIAIRQLAHWGVHHGAVDSAESAASELERAAAAGKPYDLVILDHSLPDASGPWLATMRSARGHTRPPAVALLTSRKLSTDAREGLAPGIDLCESKPLSPSRLHSLLSKAFSGSDRDATPKASGCAATGNRGNCTAAPFHNARILVAEDNVVNQKVAVLQLRKLGCEADVAGNGREALAAITTRHYDFVFMDCQMPELDGFEATRIIRKAQAAGDPAYPAHLPIIAMTAHAMAGVREECVEAGMDDYVSKPVRIERVKEMLDRYISPKQTAQAAQIT